MIKNKNNNNKKLTGLCFVFFKVFGFLPFFLRYEIMLKCWQESPTKRPTFEELVKEFDAMLVSLSDRVSSKLVLIRQSIFYGRGFSNLTFE